MHKRALFLQLEVFLDCAPHMGMCLFMEDLIRDGIQCETYLVNCNHIDEVFPVIEAGGFDIICLDSSFTVDLVNELTERFPGIPMLVGGVNAIALFLHTAIPFAISGPGRKAVREFMAQFFGDHDFSRVTNLFFKKGEEIHCASKTRAWDLPSELFPYRPHMDWKYLGPSRKANANTEQVSVVAGTGCAHSRTILSPQRYPLGESLARLGYQVSKGTLERLEAIYNRGSHGCSFCVFQLQDHTVYTRAKTTEMLLAQARHLSETFATRAFCIQTENPFPFLTDFLRTLWEEKIPLEFVSIRTRPDTLLRNEKTLRLALDMAIAHDFHFSIEEIGFETFVEQELMMFNKGVDRKTNLAALELLRSLKKAYDTAVSVHVGHGIILFHPWTTLESMTATLEVMADYPDVFPRFYPNRLTLYCEFLPVFTQVSAAGLAIRTDSGYGWDFSSLDPAAEKAFELYTILYGAFGPDISIRQYLNAIQRMEDRSLEQILEQDFNLVPAEA